MSLVTRISIVASLMVCSSALFLLPSSLAQTDIRFAVIGDYGLAGTAELDVSNLVKGWDPDFIVTTGDNNYPDGEAATIDANIGQYYSDYIYPYTGSYGAGAPTTNLFFPSLGNHDWRQPDAQPHLDYFTLPGNERYYDFTWGPVHFFIVDSDGDEPDGVSPGSTQGLWLWSGLAASSAPWKLVIIHHAPYSSGDHGSNAYVQWPFQEWGATAVISGHDHDYERIVLDGFPYFVNGLGGGYIRDFETPIPGSQVRYNDDYGAMQVEASSDSITFRFYNRSSDLIDTYTIDSGAPTRTPTVTPTITPTGAPTDTPTQTPIQTSTATPSPTMTPTSSPSSTPKQTPTQTSTATPSPTRTPTSSPSSTPTQTPTQTSTATPSPTRTPTSSPSGTPTQTPTQTPTATPSPTRTPTSSPSSTPTVTPAASATPTTTPSGPTPTPWPFPRRVNFQPAEAAPAAGYAMGDISAYGTSGEHGWR